MLPIKILIAEDDPVSRRVLATTLEKMGHDVRATEDGRQAWEAFQTEYFPVVVSDWMMPDLDGLEVCRLIRAAPRERYTYFILLTALEGRTNYLEAIEAGVDDFLVKPLDRDLLAARLRVAERILGLHQHIQQLEGLLPICSYCKSIRDEQGNWQVIEHYIEKRSKAEFTHGICPTCYEKAMAELVKEE